MDRIKDNLQICFFDINSEDIDEKSSKIKKPSSNTDIFKEGMTKKENDKNNSSKKKNDSASSKKKSISSKKTSSKKEKDNDSSKKKSTSEKDKDSSKKKTSSKKDKDNDSSKKKSTSPKKKTSSKKNNATISKKSKVNFTNEDMDKLCEMYDWYLMVKDKINDPQNDIRDLTSINVDENIVKNKKRVSVIVDESIWNDFDIICSNSSAKKGDVLTKIIKDFIKKHNDLY